MKKITMTIALSVFLATGLLAGSAGAGEALEARKNVREAAGVEAGDRTEAREAAGVDAGDRVEAREAAGVEAGDRAEARKNVREAVE